MFLNQDLMKKIILAAVVALFYFSGVCSWAGEKPAPKASGISVLADEPTGSLDSARTEEIKGILRGLTKQGITVVMVTHNLDLARSADRLLEIRDGKIHGG